MNESDYPIGRKLRVYRVTLSYACFGVLEENGRIVEAPPIARKWLQGKTLLEARNSVIARHGSMIEVH